ncbi:condensation domain-containing protein [Pseudoalteromonas rhizosphaerae]|uniref:condensation domain-containing protein n=1 Tax=Pseudoalteromonas rhizosphaerae TaxID=2518973 RepID=UPI00384C0E88
MIEKIIKEASKSNIVLFVREGELKYQAPKNAFSEELKSQIIKNKPSVINYLVEHLNGTSETMALEMDRDTAPPLKALSPLQQRLWYVYQLDEDNSKYNMYASYEIKGLEVDIEKFTESVRQLVQRHEILRTQIIGDTQGKAELTTISPNNNLVSVVDVYAEQSQVSEAQIFSKLDEINGRSFDLSQGSLIDVTLLKVNREHYVINICVPHIIADGESFNIIIQELMGGYQALVVGKAIQLPELKIQFYEYAHLEQPRVDALTASQRTYWKEQLAGVPEYHSLPTINNKKGEKDPQAEVIVTSISADYVEQAKHFCKSQKITLFTLLESIYAINVAKFSNCNDVVLGGPCNMRDSEDVKSLVGFFVNSLVYRSNVEPSLTFTDFVNENKSTILGAFANKDTPFEFLVQEVNPSRTDNYNPIFQLVINFRKFEQASKQDAALTVQPLVSKQRKIKFDIVLNVTESDGEIHLEWEYKKNLFERAFIKQFADSFVWIVEQVLTQPSLTLAKVSLLRDASESTLSNPLHLDSNTYLHSIVEHRNGALVAASDSEKSITYNQLKQYSDKLARILIKYGVVEGERVALMCGRSVEWLIAVMATSKSGASFVSIDKEMPKARAKYILKDSSPKLLIHDDADNSCVADLSFACVDIKALSWDEKDEESQFPVIHTDASELEAYVIYTSGSQGKPKGVAISHRAIVDYLMGAGQSYFSYNLTGSLALTSPAFDGSLPTLLLPLLYGKEVCFISERDVDEYMFSKMKSGDWFVKITPSQLKLILADEEVANLGAHYIVFGGEKLTPQVVNDVKKHFPNGKLFNHYGPTETTVGCCYHEVSLHDDVNEIPLGKPLPNNELKVIDKYGNIQPMFVRGELLISGLGLLQGYIGEGEVRNHEAILTDCNGQNWYKTGDIVWLSEKKDLFFVGRKDNQINKNGLRIEPKEIEDCLSLHSDIMKSVVTVDTVNNTLVAFIELESTIKARPEGADLVDFLLDHLPKNMIPAKYYYVTEGWPTNVSGKVDIKRLLAQEVELSDHQANESEMQNYLLSVWKKFTKNDDIDVNSNYFSSGGDSIISIQIAAEARKKGINISVRDFLKYQTIKSLAAVLEQRHIKETGVEAYSGESQMTPAQLAFFDKGYANPNHYNMSVCLELKTDIKLSDFKLGIKDILARHDTLRQRFDRHLVEKGLCFVDSFYEQMSEQAIEYRKFDAQALDSADFIKQHSQEVQKNFDIEQGQLFKAIFFDIENGPSKVAFFAHHLVIDVVSWQIIMAELESILMQSIAGQKCNLAPQKYNIKAWGDALVAYSNSKVLANEAPYWVEEISKPKPWLPLIPDDKKIAPQRDAISSEFVEVSVEHSRYLTINCKEIFSSDINEILLSILLLAYRRWSSNSILLLDMEGHGRNQTIEGIEPSGIVGWFTTHYPLALETKGKDDFVSILNNVKHKYQALPNHGIGFGLLRHMSKEHEIEDLAQEFCENALVFNYLGEVDSATSSSDIWKLSSTDLGVNRSVDNVDVSPVVITGMYKDNSLRFNFSYSKNKISQTSVRVFADHFASVIEEDVIGAALSVQQANTAESSEVDEILI